MEWLRNKHVAATGHLACMSHGEFAELIHSFEGVFSSAVKEHTDILIVGRWPLQSDGRLTKKLRAARALQRKGLPIMIRTEDDFLAELGLTNDSMSNRRLYNIAELALLLHVPGDRLRRWLSSGWIKPVKNEKGVQFYDFQQVIGIKKLWQLMQSAVSPKRIRRSLQQIKAWMNIDDPLSQLAFFQENGQLFVRLKEGMVEPSGQMHLEFEEDAATIQIDQPESAEDWFKAGRKHEQAEQWRLAAESYRRALLLGGTNAFIAFNLANVLYAWGKNEAAVERYYQAVELKSDYGKAWNNLAGVLAELQLYDEAITAYRRAVDAGHPDSHYNLAGALEQIGRTDEAREHWQAYLNYDAESEWGRVAAERLGAIGN